MNRQILISIMLALLLLLAGSAALIQDSIPVMAGSVPGASARTVVIDPGHGGEDGGAVSCTGLNESGLNLQISLRLSDLLRLLGCPTRLTRADDCSVHTGGETIAQRKASDLRHRAEMTAETPGAILVSIHQNQFPESRYWGAQVFYAPTDGSSALADRLQEMLIENLNPGSRRTSKPAQGIYLLEHIPCTGILVECGFLSNPEEEQHLQDPDYQRQLCCVIAACLVNEISALPCT